MDRGLPHQRLLGELSALMKVLSRWIDLMPMIAVSNLTFCTGALTWLNHSGCGC